MKELHDAQEEFCDCMKSIIAKSERKSRFVRYYKELNEEKEKIIKDLKKQLASKVCEKCGRQGVTEEFSQLSLSSGNEVIMKIMLAYCDQPPTWEKQRFCRILPYTFFEYINKIRCGSHGPTPSGKALLVSYEGVMEEFKREENFVRWVVRGKPSNVICSFLPVSLDLKSFNMHQTIILKSVEKQNH